MLSFFRTLKGGKWRFVGDGDRCPACGYLHKPTGDGDGLEHASAKVKQDPRTPYSQRLLTPARVKKIHRALAGTLHEHALGEADCRDLTILKRVGLLDTDVHGEIIATTDVMRSLYPEGIPT